MTELTDADQVWNRALDPKGQDAALGAGDRALSALLLAHGLAMSGGVWHALETLSANQLEAAVAGFRYLGFGQVADVLSDGASRIEAAEDASLEEQEALEAELNDVYHASIPRDQTLVNAFEQRLRLHPSEFAPIEQ